MNIFSKLSVIVAELAEIVWSQRNGRRVAVGGQERRPGCRGECLKKPGFNVNNELMNGRNALHYAADYGQAEVVSLLLKLKADINTPDKFGITPLLAAVYEGHKDVVKVLLEKGADKSGKAPDGSSYLACAESDEIKALLK
ncbi:Myotrophin [Geodia barretti]|uniref:Myotrophin n=1 Tax=Geodia barretti TaxID=519541 RepID=A0AA35RQQ9_GEOBA|nr:Myotrophin [Geodia barretti]